MFGDVEFGEAGTSAAAVVLRMQPVRSTRPRANAWLERRGVDAVVDRPATLAELYALAGGRPVAEAAAFGFVR